MAAPLNPAASEHLPLFITPPGETDVLMVVTAAILAVAEEVEEVAVEEAARAAEAAARP